MNTFLHSLKVLFLVMVSVFSANVFGQTETLACPLGTISNNTMTFTTANFSVVHAKGTDSNFAAYSPWRVYTNNTVQFNGGNNVQKINSIVITAETTAHATAVAASGSVITIVNGTGTATASASGTTVTINITGNDVKSVRIKPSAQTRWTNIAINYTSLVSSYSINYNGNGNTSGTVPTAQTGISSGASVTLANNTGSLVRTGYTFNGWNTVQNGGAGTHYAAGASYTMPSNNVTMYADWKALPKLSPSATHITGFDYNLGAGPVVKTFTLLGTNLNGSDVGLLLGGTDFQISADGATYSDNINYPAYDGSLKTVYVRLKAGLAAAAYSDEVVISGGGAADASVNLSGTVKAPVLTANPLTLSGFAYHQGEGPSNSQSFSLSGQNLTGSQNVEILPGENWEVSTNQSNWFTYDNPLILNNYAGAATPVYVRLKAGLAEGIYNNASNDIVVVTGYGISAGPEVMLSGEVTSPLPPPVVTGATVSGTYNTPFNYTVTASNSPTSFAIVSGELPGGLSLNTTSGAISGTPTAAGSFTAQISAANYSGTGSPAELIFNISKKTQAVTFGALSDKVYGDSPFTLSATADSGLAVAYSSSHPEVASVSGTTVTVTGTGTATITATQAGNSNYASATAVQNLKVTAKPLTVSGLTANHKMQDGTTSATLSGTAALTNVVAGDEGDVTLSGTPVGTFASASPGTAVAVTVTGLSLTGDKAANYTLTPLVLSADITPLGAPVATAATNVGQNTFTANWNEVAGATEYQLDVYEKILGDDVNGVENFDGVIANGNLVGAGSTFQNGWSFLSGGSRQIYTSVGNFGITAPSYAFTATGDYIQTAIYPSPVKSFSFWAKQQGGSSSSTLVQGYDGSQWVTIATLSNGDTAIATGGVKTYNLVSLGYTNITQIKMTFTKAAGNLSVDDVSVSYSGLSNVPVSGSPFTIAAPSVSHEVTGLAAETEYYYAVKSKSGTVLSPKSNKSLSSIGRWNGVPRPGSLCGRYTI